MLIGLQTDFFSVRITFRSVGSISETVRSVELTYEEARELCTALAKVVGDQAIHLYEQDHNR